jgi:hypothetical protein
MVGSNCGTLYLRNGIWNLEFGIFLDSTNVFGMALPFVADANRHLMGAEAISL